MGEQLQRHVLKGQSRPMEKLQHPGGVIQRAEGRDGRIVETVGSIGGVHRLLNFSGGKILQVELQDLEGPARIGHLAQRGGLLRRDDRKHGRHEEPAVGRQPAQNRLAGGDAAAAAGGKEGHLVTPPV